MNRTHRAPTTTLHLHTAYAPSLADARCDRHPERQATHLCGRCKDFACADCYQSPTCVVCAERQYVAAQTRPASLHVLIAMSLFLLLVNAALIASVIHLAAAAEAGDTTALEDGVIEAPGCERITVFPDSATLLDI